LERHPLRLAFGRRFLAAQLGIPALDPRRRDLFECDADRGPLVTADIEFCLSVVERLAGGRDSVHEQPDRFVRVEEQRRPGQNRVEHGVLDDRRREVLTDQHMALVSLRQVRKAELPAIGDLAAANHTVDCGVSKKLGLAETMVPGPGLSNLALPTAPRTTCFGARLASCIATSRRPARTWSSAVPEASRSAASRA
jgi:hypothetical protein